MCRGDESEPISSLCNLSNVGNGTQRLGEMTQIELLSSVLVSRGSLKILRRIIAPLRDRFALTTALWGDWCRISCVDLPYSNFTFRIHPVGVSVGIYPVAAIVAALYR